MFNISSSEFLFIIIVAIVCISPKHLPIVFFKLGVLYKKLRIYQSKLGDSISEISYEADPRIESRNRINNSDELQKF